MDKKNCYDKEILLNTIIEHLPKADYSFKINDDELWLFNDSYIIIKNKNSIIKYPINDLIVISKKSLYVLIVKTNSVTIKNTSIDDSFKKYLDNIKEESKIKKHNKNDIILDINKNHIKKPIMNCPNNINEKNLNTFYKNKHNYFKTFLSSYLIILIITIIIGTIVFVIPRAIYSINYDYAMFYTFLSLGILLLVLINMKKIINNKVKDNIKNLLEEELYIYDDFLIVKMKKGLIALDYTNINLLFNKDDYTFISFKNYKNPIIISTKEIINNKIELLKNIH